MFEDLKFALSLGSDNHSGVHPRVLESLAAANRGYAHAYGMDELSLLTEREFQRVFGDNVQAHYVFTGTAANVLSLAPLVRSYQAVICSDVAHVNLDECGAPEKFWGAKLLPVSTRDGRITPENCAEYLERLGDQHHSQPCAVSLTQPTEFGVCYSLDELRRWRAWTREKKLWLHLDGARLANAAVHLGVGLQELTSDIGVDVVSFGGTKNGLMGAEAVLLFSEEARHGFKFYRKQSMQLPSKTRFIAAQFHAYLHQDLWRDLAAGALAQARELARALQEFPEIQLEFPVESNALFVRLPHEWIKPLRERVFFYVWDRKEGVCRWMISHDWTREKSEIVVNAIREVKACFHKK